MNSWEGDVGGNTLKGGKEMISYTTQVMYMYKYDIHVTELSVCLWEKGERERERERERKRRILTV